MESFVNHSQYVRHEDHLRCQLAHGAYLLLANAACVCALLGVGWNTCAKLLSCCFCWCCDDDDVASKWNIYFLCDIQNKNKFLHNWFDGDNIIDKNANEKTNIYWFSYIWILIYPIRSDINKYALNSCIIKQYQNVIDVDIFGQNIPTSTVNALLAHILI